MAIGRGPRHLHGGSARRGNAAASTIAGPVFDAHCHVFNLEYLLLEATQILWDMIRGEYPLPPEAMIEDTVAIRPDFELRNPLDAAEHLLAWIVEIGFAAFQSETANVKELRRTAARVWRVDTLSLVPLMMDIYYLFASPLGLEESAEFVPGRNSGDPPGDIWDARARVLRMRIARGVGRVHDRVAHAGAAARKGARGRIERLIGATIERVLRPHGALTAAGMPGFKLTAGFARQFQAMSALGRKGSGIFPFFAVDPRRDGAVEWVITSGQVGRNGP
ncbi:MAG: hypothetical protein NTU62_09725, partial [Spirochaetes bacterium]|nr:hypothetical protein [Spirochaetota bacterium]